MERLVEKKMPSSPEEARLVELIEASLPIGISDATRQELLSNILASRHRRWGVSFLLRPAVAFGILLLAGVTTAATLGHRWIEQKVRGTGPTTTVGTPPPAAPAHDRRLAGPATTPAPTPTLAPTVEAPLASDLVVGKLPRSRSAKIDKGEDPSRVVAAIQALRNDHDPDRAARLLADYLKTYPHGALSEEAIALSIEAAAARHSASATMFAEKYLRDYPNGRFRRAAEQALARPQP